MLFKICTLCRVQHSTLIHICAVYCSGKVALHSNTPSGTCSSSSYPHVSARGDLCFCTAYTLNIHCKYIAHTNFRTHSATQDNHHVLARGNLCFCTAYIPCTYVPTLERTVQHRAGWAKGQMTQGVAEKNGTGEEEGGEPEKRMCASL